MLCYETLQHSNGFEFLTYFKVGDIQKPLIVFLPGWGHLGRIAYGGADISSEEFLAHAFAEQGFSFLSISYPLENAVYSNIYPHLQINDWAQSAAAIAQEILQRYAYPYLIPVHWSASGHLMTRFKEATQLLGISQPFSVSLEATPPIVMTPEGFSVVDILDNGLASVKKLYPVWLQHLRIMLGMELDLKIYEKTFLGAFPVSLLGTSQVYCKGRIQDDLASSIEDRHCFHYAKSPLVVSITGNSQLDPDHILVDRASWSFINQRKIYHGYLAPLTTQLQQLSDVQWQKLRELIDLFNQKVTACVPGNHFLLIGKSRTKKIVQIVQESEKAIFAFRNTLADLLKIDVAKLN